MNAREKFLGVMDFDPAARAPKWEFAYWGATIKRWYAEGLPEQDYPALPTRIETVSSSLYTPAFTHDWRRTRNLFELTFGERERRISLPDGIAVWGGALYWPSQGFPLDSDVARYFGFDTSTALVHVEQLFYPRFEPQVLREDDKFVDYVDIDGVTRRFQKHEGVIPTAIAWPIRDWDTWFELKHERLRLDNIPARLPPQWPELVTAYRNRDYPLALGGYPLGFFGLPAHLMGYMHLFYGYYDQPELIKDMLQHFTALWLAVWEEVLAYVDVDVVHIFEDMSANKGSMVSPGIFGEFMAPYYRQITDFAKGRGIKTTLVDTDGNCEMLIPLLMQAGVTGLYPMEVSAGMDVVAARKKFPTLQMMGGIPKHDIAYGRQRIDEFLADVAWLLRQGGYIPFADHSVPPDVPWEHFKYYRTRLNELIDTAGAG
jgi:uroporphyrinogen decarboxylase